MELLCRFVHALEAKGCRVRQHADGKVRAQCPAHRDRKPSLSVTLAGTRLLVNCFTGCNTSDILAALGLSFSDLFSLSPSQPTPRPRQVAVYTYADASGIVVAEKVRYEPKQFRWRRPDRSAPQGYTWNLEGLEGRLPLYRLPELRGPLIILTEGEKAVDRLRALGLTATCPPSGAGSWPDRFTEELVRIGINEIAILPDADRPGHQQAERIAASIHRTSHMGVREMRTKILDLPNLPASGDVVDWLDAGGGAIDLTRRIAETPLWFPGQRERDRLERKKKLNAARQQRHRDRARRLRLAATA